MDLKKLFKKKSNLLKRKFTPKEWVAFVKSWKFDQLPQSQKGLVFSQIMSFR